MTSNISAILITTMIAGIIILTVILVTLLVIESSRPLWAINVDGNVYISNSKKALKYALIEDGYAPNVADRLIAQHAYKQS